jgi:ribonuclease E
MSEQTAAVITAPTEATPVAPATSPTPDGAAAAPATPAKPAATEQAQAAPEAPRYMNKQEAKRSLREMFRSRSEAAEAAEAALETPAEPAAPEAAPEPVVDAAGRKHDPATGKFVADTDTPAADGAREAGVPEPQGEGAPDAPAVETPPNMVRLELPEALREQGRDFVEVPAEQERTYRALLNGYARRAEVEAAQGEMQRMREQVLRLQAEGEAREKSFDDPALQAAWAKYQAVAEVDPEAADLLRAGIEQKLKANAEGRFQELSTERQQQEVQGHAAQFRSQTVAAAQHFYPQDVQSPEFAAAYQRALFTYGSEIEMAERTGQPASLSLERFVAHLDREAREVPSIRNRLLSEYRSQQEAEAQKRAQEAEQRARAEAAEAERQRLLQTGTRHADRNPLANIASQVRTDKLSMSTNDDLSSVPMHQRKQAIKQRLFGAAR